MIDHELHPEVYRAPDNWYQGRSGHHKPCITYRAELNKLTDDERDAFHKHIERELAPYQDLLTIAEVSKITGYCDTSIHRWCNKKELKFFNISGKFLIPKISLTEFLSSEYGFGITRKTWKHILLIRSFFDNIEN